MVTQGGFGVLTNSSTQTEWIGRCGSNQADRNSDCRSVGVASGLARKQNLALACLNICAEVVEHNSGMCSRELMPDLSPFLYIHSATAHLLATLFKKRKNFFETRTLRRRLLRHRGLSVPRRLRGLFLFFFN